MNNLLKILFVILVSITFSLTTSAKAAPVQKPIYIYNNGNIINTGKNALVDWRETFVPIEILETCLPETIYLDQNSDKFYINFSPEKFKFNLETKKLDNLIAKGVKLNFPIIKTDQTYINIYGLERLLGISVHNRTLGENGTLDIVLGLKDTLPAVKLNTPRPVPSFSGKINLVWDHIRNYPPNNDYTQKISGLDVISPTWFAIINEHGDISNNADFRYVEDAQAKGYKVWALITNSFDPVLTNKMLSSGSARENVIKQLVLYSSLYNLDGINIDFENVYDRDKDKLTNFVKELTLALKEQNLTISIDVTVPSNTPNGSSCYDRAKLGSIVDYVMVMTYDEHWRTSPVSGSTASYNWVDRNIAATLNYVPQKKLLLGIPFYTREWEETKLEGRIITKARTLSMSDSQEIIAKYRPEIKWLPNVGQYYIEYNNSDGDKLYRVWLEDEKSIALKANLVHKYDLAGAASWRKGFETPNIWITLENILKQPQK